VLPTIADTLGIKMPFKVDGRSLRDPSYTGRPDVEMEQTSGKRVRMSIAQFEARKRASLARRIAQFGTGSWKPVYDIGPRTDLIGRAVSAKGGSGPDASVQFSDQFADVQPASGVVPAHVRGRLSDKVPVGSTLAYALNDKVVATGTSFKPVGRYKVEFTALLPADAFVKGRNKLDIFRVDGDSLARIGGA
jgi:hypothetical protein